MTTNEQNAVTSVDSFLKLVAVPCPVCDSRNCTTLYMPWNNERDPAKLYGAASGIPGTQVLVRCSSCGMIYENPRHRDEAILQGYMSSNEAGHDSQFEMRVGSFLRALQRLGDKIPPSGSKILDIGTAGGAFLEAATRHGSDAWGMEPSRFLVEQGQKRGLNIRQGTIDKHDYEPASFDMITLWDVIEHLTDPKAALREVHRLLKPQGVFLINYPDIGTWMARMAGKKFWWILSVHLHHFTQDTITNICQRTGFEAFHFRPYWQTLEFGYLEKMAIHYKMPLAEFLTKLTPEFIQRIPIPYYASQTTALARPVSA